MNTSYSSARRRSVGATALLAVVALAVAGCSGSTDSARPDGESTSASTSEPTSDPTTEPTSDPTIEPTPGPSSETAPAGPTPATGPELDYEGLVVRAPDGYELDGSMGPFDVGAYGEQAGTKLTLSAYPAQASGADDMGFVEAYVEEEERGEKVEKRPSREVDGITMLHRHFPVDADGGTASDKFYGQTEGNLVIVRFLWGADTTQAYRDQTMDAVLASADWGR